MNDGRQSNSNHALHVRAELRHNTRDGLQKLMLHTMGVMVGNLQHSQFVPCDKNVVPKSHLYSCMVRS